MADYYRLLEKYHEHMILLNRSKKTIKNHLWSLKRFISFMESFTLNNIGEITKDHLKEYQKYCHYWENRFNKKDEVAVQNQHIAIVKRFFKFLKDEEFISFDPALNISYGKEPRKLPKSALTDEEMEKILLIPDTGTILGYRDRTILELLYSTGIRKAELINLKVQDADYMEGRLKINQGKGAKDRVVPVGKIACKYLESYIKGIRPHFLNADKNESLFLSRIGRPMGEDAVLDMVARYAKKTDIKKHVTTHTFRRSCATEMIKNKANIMHVKDLLGHNSMRAIQAYCNLSIVDLKEAHRLHHPRERV